MYKRFIPLLVLFSLSSLFAHPAAKRLLYDRDWMYQSILINGEFVYRSKNQSGGVEIAEQRYEAIKSVLKRYERPFTLLDLGANNGYFSLRVAEDFDAVCVMVDSTDRLSDICTLNTERNKIIHLKKLFSYGDLQKLASLEHFDVILALHVLHHVDNGPAWVQTLLQMGDNVIIETPSENDIINQFPHTKRLAIYLKNLPHKELIGSFPRHGVDDYMFWLCRNKKGFVQQKKRLGILPTTFFTLYGSFPSPNYVRAIEATMRQQGNTKWILQGIDYYVE